ncbi:flagellar protein FlgN [Bacillus massilinigeriensis]|uniref:flagellar protein FlgN n=1 Tax=Bacillus mediterraneensis TaxID=1805474 RepID=UPI0008F8D66A|nr:flagellar protein FlgN [Bacillus mediterraneensis]
MTAQLIPVMEKLLKLHQSLQELTVRKTAIVKKGDIESLNDIIKKEQAHISAIEKLDKEREKVSASLFPGINNATLSMAAEKAEDDEKSRLLELKESLLTVIDNIKENNLLNQQLIHQSLQFISFSRNLVMPQQENYNYGPQKRKTNEAGQGLFNGKA